MELLALSVIFFPYTYNESNVVDTIAPSFFIESSSNVQDQESHKISDEFEFQSHLSSNFGVTSP